MKAKCVKIYLNPDNPIHRQILDYLEDSELSDSKALIRAVMDGLRYREERKEKDHFLQEVKTTLRECFREAQGQTESLGFTPQPSEPEEPAVSPLDFLTALGL